MNQALFQAAQQKAAQDKSAANDRRKAKTGITGMNPNSIRHLIGQKLWQKARREGERLATGGENETSPSFSLWEGDEGALENAAQADARRLVEAQWEREGNLPPSVAHPRLFAAAQEHARTINHGTP